MDNLLESDMSPENQAECASVASMDRLERYFDNRIAALNNRIDELEKKIDTEPPEAEVVEERAHVYRVVVLIEHDDGDDIVVMDDLLHIGSFKSLDEALDWVKRIRSAP